MAHDVFNLPLADSIKQERPDTSFKDNWVKPDDYTLCFLLRAAEKLKNFSLAKQAWDTLTTEFNVRASAISTQIYLRCASTCHAGAAAAEIISSSKLRSKDFTEWNFVMAMKACVTSGGPRQSIANATRVLELAEGAKKAGMLVLRNYLLVAQVTKDAAILKTALLRIECHLKPTTLQALTERKFDVPRELGDTVTKFLFTLKKSIFWDTITWGKHEEVRWMETLRAVRKTLKAWDTRTAEEEAVEAARIAEIEARAALELEQSEAEKAAKREARRLRETQGLEQIVAGLASPPPKLRVAQSVEEPVCAGMAAALW